MSGELFFADSTACDGDNHYDRTVSVTDVIRYDQNRTEACLFGTDDWIKLCIVEVAASYLFFQLLLPPFITSYNQYQGTGRLSELTRVLPKPSCA